MDAFTTITIGTLTFITGMLFARLVSDPILFGLLFSSSYHSVKESIGSAKVITLKSVMLIALIIASSTWAILVKASVLIPALLIVGTLVGVTWAIISNQSNYQE